MHDKNLSDIYARNIAQSKIEFLIDEMEKGVLDRKGYNNVLAFHYRTQTRGRDLETSRDHLVELLNLLEVEELREKSLELQMWWRDYNEIEEAKRDSIEKENLRQMYRESGIAKLTPEEIDALNIKL